MTKADREWLEAFEVWIWRMLKSDWKDKATDVSVYVLEKVNKERWVLNLAMITQIVGACAKK